MKVNGKDYSQYIIENKIHVPNHKSVFNGYSCSYGYVMVNMIYGYFIVINGIFIYKQQQRAFLNDVYYLVT